MSITRISDWQYWLAELEVTPLWHRTVIFRFTRNCPKIGVLLASVPLPRLPHAIAVRIHRRTQTILRWRHTAELNTNGCS